MKNALIKEGIAKLKWIAFWPFHQSLPFDPNTLLLFGAALLNQIPSVGFAKFPILQLVCVYTN